MKLRACLTTGVLLLFTTGASTLADENPTVIRETKHDLSAPLALMKSPPPKAGKARERVNRIPDLASRFHGAALPEDPLLLEMGTPEPRAPMPPPIITFEGTSDDDNAAIVGFRVVPPDTNGDVGPNHYVQWNNLVFAVYNKSTGQIAAGFPKAGNALFTGFGGVCETTNDGDPIALYDQFANRWVLSQFSINTGVQCVAVSQTADPTGAYYRYAFDVSAGMNDYPKMGVWPDGYYLTFNEFSGSFTQVKVAAFERAKMLAGQSAQMVVFGVTAPAGSGCNAAGDCYFSLQPPHVEGTTQPPAGAPAPFGMVFDDESWSTTPDATKDFYKLWKFTVNWANPGSSTFTGPVSVQSPEFDAELCNFSRNCIPQKGTTQTLDTLSAFTMYRMVYRRFSGNESLLFSHTVDVGANRAGVRFAEIRDPNGTPTLYQAGTHAPADGENRWMPSVAMDKDGNIAIGYSVSSANTYPSIRYVGRLSGDPLGTLPQTEAEMLAGTGSQTGANRWGDYSALSIDESDDCTFWFTTEYYQVTGSFDFNTRIGSFKFPSCTTGPTGTLSGTVTAANNGNPISGATVQAGQFSTTTNGSGAYSMVIPTGTYDVTASAFGYQPQTVNGVVVNQDQTTTQNFSLTPVPALTVDGFVTDGSGAGWPLYARIDVATTGGPTVTVFTDPNTGYYSTSAFANTAYTFTVTSQLPGYVVATRNVTTGSTDRQENFALQVNGQACNAPGYTLVTTPVLSESFTNGIPGTWSVTNTTTNCSASGNPQWNTANPGLRTNMTGGAGLFSIADSDKCGSAVSMNTDLVSPNLDLTSLGGGESLQISFIYDYRDLCTVSAGDSVTLDVWNGSTWTTVFTFCGPSGGASRRGPRVETFNTSAANGAAAAKVRWHYKGGWDWWWEVDNVNLALAECQFKGGGLIYGNVYDANTNLALNGASVSLDTGQSTTTAATPDDPNRDDGFYLIYAPLSPGNATGVRTITVKKPRYGTARRQVVPRPNGSLREDFLLAAGRLSANPLQLRMRLPIGGNGNKTLTLTNSGGLDANYNVLEINAPLPASAPAAPFKAPALPYDPDTVEGQRVSVAHTAEGLPAQAKAVNAPIVPNAGESVSEFTTTLALPWGAGYNQDATDLWISNIGPPLAGGDNKDHRFLPSGTDTGDTVDTAASGGVWAADMAYNARTGMFWQVNVGGDNCLFEFNPATKQTTGNKICPSFGTSMRGLAYNPVKDTYYVGTWNGGFVTEVAPDGTILRRKTVGLNVSGLAFNPTSGHLFAQVNDANQVVYVLDVNNNFGIAGSFQLKDQAGNPAYAANQGAGIEIDCQGNLWSINQVTKKVFANKSGETKGVCVTDIPWLSESPKTSTVAAGGSTDVTVTFNAVGQPPGCKEAQAVVINDTPYGDIALPAGLTVQFGDVPAGSFADAFIHGIAGAGISYGCGGGNFCPTSPMTRALMSVWLLRAKFGSDYKPAPAVGIFADVSPESFAADYIEDLYNRGITGGCATNPLRYCPDSTVLRQQMAVFLLKTLLGSTYTPPACTGVFGDVPCSNPFGAWIEDLFTRGISSGCSANPPMFCPTGTTNRSQMSVFVSRTFGVPSCKQ